MFKLGIFEAPGPVKVGISDCFIGPAPSVGIEDIGSFAPPKVGIELMGSFAGT